MNFSQSLLLCLILTQSCISLEKIICHHKKYSEIIELPFKYHEMKFGDNTIKRSLLVVREGGRERERSINVHII
jgi:hypothetical protein